AEGDADPEQHQVPATTHDADRFHQTHSTRRLFGTRSVSAGIGIVRLGMLGHGSFYSVKCGLWTSPYVGDSQEQVSKRRNRTGAGEDGLDRVAPDAPIPFQDDLVAGPDPRCDERVVRITER